MPPPHNKKRNEFFVDTKTICFLCLKEIASLVNLKDEIEEQLEQGDNKQFSHAPPVNKLGYKEKIQKDKQHERHVINGEKFNMSRIFHYLKLYPGKLFRKEFTGSLFTSKELLNNITNWKVLLCQDCFSFATGLSEMCLELELLQIKLNHSLQLFQDIIENSEKDPEKEENLRERLTNPQEFIHETIADLFRKGTKEKCNERLKICTPRVHLSDMQVTTAIATINPEPLVVPHQQSSLLHQPTTLLHSNPHPDSKMTQSTLSTPPPPERIRFKCPQCNATFLSKNCVLKHQKSRHPIGDTPYTCNTCGVKFDSKPEWIRHTKLYCSSRRTSCKGQAQVKLENPENTAISSMITIPETGVIVNLSTLLNPISNFKMENEKFLCTLCPSGGGENLAYFREQHFKIHLFVEHPDYFFALVKLPETSTEHFKAFCQHVVETAMKPKNDPGDSQFASFTSSCILCSGMFYERQSMNAHVIQNHFSILASKLIHLQRNTRAEQACEHCGKHFSNSFSRRRHQRLYCSETKNLVAAADIDSGAANVKEEREQHNYFEGDDGEEQEEEVYLGAYTNTKIEVLEMNPVPMFQSMEGVETEDPSNVNSMEGPEEGNCLVSSNFDGDMILPDVGDPLN